jgi:CheY-like chemotaxis protein
MPIRILIAEDNPSVRTALRSLLESAGPWEIVDVENGQEAVAKAQELKPNLIILDLVMPVMDGLSAARQISKLLPEVPVLMHTMHWSRQIEREAQKVGVRKVMPKVDSRLLVSTVQQLLTPAASSPPPAASATIPSNLLTPNVAPAPPILESGGATSAKPEGPPAEAAGIVPRNRRPT